MKNRHLYTVLAGAFLLLSITNLATLYLYMKEKIQHHRVQTKITALHKQWQTGTESALRNYQEDVQKRFVETAQVFQLAKEDQGQIKQQLISALTQRGKGLQRFYSNPRATVTEAAKIIQEDSRIFNLYNQYLQFADGREAVLMDKTKQLGASLGNIGKKPS